ncbi:hypothetical protein BKA63DRAFT_493721 [Paraphoma chrysanthemicola]|nr:hypothetical protein BKA63DRAFT_493721 [Paraphoma chrysanthemicola]
MRFINPVVLTLASSASAVTFYAAKGVCSAGLGEDSFPFYPAIGVRSDGWNCDNIKPAIVVREEELSNERFTLQKGVPSCGYNDKLHFYNKGDHWDYHRPEDNPRMGVCYRVSGKIKNCFTVGMQCGFGNEVWECHPERAGGPCF